MISEIEKQEAFQAEMNAPLNGIDRLRLWLTDPESFSPIDLDDAEEILARIDTLETRDS